jgi:hypothetical protein
MGDLEDFGKLLAWKSGNLGNLWLAGGSGVDRQGAGLAGWGWGLAVWVLEVEMRGGGDCQEECAPRSDDICKYFIIHNLQSYLLFSITYFWSCFWSFVVFRVE